MHRSRSWRFGFQVTAVLVAVSFLLGVLYRPASLYHPQRRAILHLKSLQKRSRLKDQHLKTQTTAQNSLASAFSSATAAATAAGATASGTGNSAAKAAVQQQQQQRKKKASDKPAYFDFSVLRSRTIQIVLAGSCITHFGFAPPLFLLVSRA